MKRSLILIVKLLVPGVLLLAEGTISNTAHQTPPELICTEEWSRKMKYNVGTIALSDVNRDGVDEVLMGAGPRLFLLEGSTGDYMWRSEFLKGDVTAIAIGDSDKDGVNEIVCGTASGCVYVFDGDTYMLEQFGDGFDDRVTSILIEDIDADGIPEILVGTCCDSVWSIPDWEWMLFAGGRIYEVNGLTFVSNCVTPRISTVGQVRALEVRSKGRYCKELILGFEYYTIWYLDWGPDQYRSEAGIRILNQKYSKVFEEYLFEYAGAPEDKSAKFSSLAVGNCDGDNQKEIIASCISTGEERGMKLCIFDTERTEEICISRVGDDTPVNGLALADLNKDGIQEIIAASKDGIITLLSGITLDTLAVSTQLMPISKFAFGNTDVDAEHEICIGYRDSLVVLQLGPLTGVEYTLPDELASTIYLKSYPNPFVGATQVRYGLVRDGWVNIIIYNLSGQVVRMLIDKFQHSGVHTIIWDGRDNSGRTVSSGPYFLRLRAGEYTAMRKLSVMR